MILALYNRLKKVSLIEHGDIVLDAEIIKSQTGRARKLRLVLIDNTYVDVWYSEDRRYAYHWEQSGRWNFIYRHDNAPHKSWATVSTFPKHCHEGTESNVKDSHLSDDPEKAICEFLGQVRLLMITLGLTIKLEEE